MTNWWLWHNRVYTIIDTIKLNVEDADTAILQYTSKQENNISMCSTVLVSR